MYISIIIFTVLSLFAGYTGDDILPEIDNQESEQAELLKFLNDAPESLELTDKDVLIQLDAYKKEARQAFSSEIIIDVAKTLLDILDKKGSFQKGIETLEFLEATYSGILSESQNHKLTIMISEFYNRTGQYSEVLTQLEPILSSIENPGILGGALASLGLANNQLGRYDIAVEQYLDAIEAYKRGDHPEFVAEIYNRLGMLYYYIEEYKTSIRYYLMHLETAEELGDIKKLGNGYVNIGASYRAAGDLDTALDYYEKGVAMAEQTGNVVDMARVNMNMANLYAEQKQFEKALQYYRKSLAVSEVNGLGYGILINHYNIGNTLFDMGNFDESEKSYLTAYSLMNRENHKNPLMQLSDRLSRLYENNGEFDKAFPFLETYTELNRECFDSETLKIAEDLRVKYETEIQQQEIELANAVINAQKIRNNFLGLFLFFSFLSLIGTFIYYRKRNIYLRELYERNLEVVKTLGIGLQPTEVKDSKGEGTEINTEEKRRLDVLHAKIKSLMVEKKIYTDPSLSLTNLAEMAGSNRRYVSEAINKAAHMNLNDYINFYRINEAKKLIAEGEDSLSDVQYSCGFNSRTTFYTAFKKFTSMTPSEFRKLSRNR